MSDDDIKKLYEKLKQVLELHYKMRGCYLWAPPRIASDRKNYEEEHSNRIIFEYQDGNSYSIEQKTSCSSSHVYYRMSIYKNGELLKADIRYIKKMIRQIENYLEYIRNTKGLMNYWGCEDDEFAINIQTDTLILGFDYHLFDNDDNQEGIADSIERFCDKYDFILWMSGRAA